VSRSVSPVRATLAQLSVELRLTARRGENLLVTILIPAAVLVFFATVDVVPTDSERALDFLVPGALALAVIATGLVNLGIATAYERSYGVLKRLGGSPLTRANLIAAKVGAVLVIVVIQTVLLLAIAWLLLGWRPGPGGSAVLFLATLLLGTLTFAGLGLLLAGALRAEVTLALANGLFLATMLLGGIVVPLDRLPGPLASIAEWFPGAALAEGFRIALGASGDPLVAMTILAAWGIAAVAFAIRTFRWE
jgi:ABC-2 type transport system permease protein